VLSIFFRKRRLKVYQTSSGEQESRAPAVM